MAWQVVRDLILSAEVICFPIGSFWTSVMANLLPAVRSPTNITRDESARPNCRYISVMHG